MSADGISAHGELERRRGEDGEYVSKSRAVIIDNIPFQPDLKKLARKLRVKEGSRYEGQLSALVAEAREVAKPRAMYRVAFVDGRHEASVVIDGIRFESRVLRVNLDGTHRVFPYAATCGHELYEWMKTQDDMLLSYYADVISETALRHATAALESHLARRFRLGRTSTMAPGSLPDWPIRQQRPLFDLLGDPEKDIGIQLTDSMLMIPSKSISGIRFPVEKTFESCQLCPRDNCPSRQAPYDEGLYERRYHVEKHPEHG
ncbi:MAG: vitamin B12 dependent-methionine synthase activation domain-containing protein [Anaerolineae bacterium]|jgi:hypothetical protein